MDMFESKYIIGSADSRSAWQDYAQFLKNLMQQHVASSTKNVIFTAHTKTQYNETEMQMETKVPIKGALTNQGIEAFFSTILYTKAMKAKELEGYSSDLLNWSEDEIEDKFKYVFQTRKTADTVHERMRGPIGLFNRQETYTDNNCAMILNRLHEYYSE